MNARALWETSRRSGGVIGLSVMVAAGAFLATGGAGPEPGAETAGAHAATAEVNLGDLVNQAKNLYRSELVDLGARFEPGEAVRTAIKIRGRVYTLDLQLHSIRSDRYQVFLSGPGGTLTEVPPGPVNTLRGTAVEDPGSEVVASVMDGGLWGNVRFSNGETYWFEPVARSLGRLGDPALRGVHVVYLADEVIPSGGTCGTTANFLAESGMVPGATGGSGEADGGGLPFRTEIAVDADFQYFQRWGANVESRINTVLNTMDDEYRRDVNIRHEIVTIIIRTSQIYFTTDPGTLLNAFRSQWTSNHNNIRRDIAHLFTGKNLNGNVIGIAWIGQICASRFGGLGYSLVQSDCCGSLLCSTDLSAHELGHNWNAQHCNCPNNTMNAGLTCRNRFHATFTIPTIVAFRNSRNCLDQQPEAPANDDCANAVQVLNQTPIEYSTVNSSTDGPGLPGSCNEGGGNALVKDVWFKYISICDGIATADICNSDFDNRIVVYDGLECTGPLLACSDDDCGDGGTRAQASFPVQQFQWYLIRIGSRNTTGSGVLNVSCENGQPCPEDLDDSGSVDFGDLLAVLAAWGPCGGCPEDLDGSGAVDFGDILAVLSAWGPCP